MMISVVTNISSFLPVCILCTYSIRLHNTQLISKYLSYIMSLLSILGHFKGLFKNTVVIDYKSISLNHSYYIRSNWIRWRDGSYVENTSDSKIAPFLEESYSGFDNYKVFMKCYALKLPDDVYFLNGTVQDFGLLISNDIFPSGKRPLIYGISTLIHYPNQLLRSYETQRYSWDQRSNNCTEMTT